MMSSLIPQPPSVAHGLGRLAGLSTKSRCRPASLRAAARPSARKPLLSSGMLRLGEPRAATLSMHLVHHAERRSGRSGGMMCFLALLLLAGLCLMRGQAAESDHAPAIGATKLPLAE